MGQGPWGRAGWQLCLSLRREACHCSVGAPGAIQPASSGRDFPGPGGQARLLLRPGAATTTRGHLGREWAGAAVPGTLPPGGEALGSGGLHTVPHSG